MRRRDEVLSQDGFIERVQNGTLEWPLEHPARIPHQLLLERIVARDEDCERVAPTAARPSRLLRHRGRRARIAQVEGGIQRANVDA